MKNVPSYEKSLLFALFLIYFNCKFKIIDFFFKN